MDGTGSRYGERIVVSNLKSSLIYFYLFLSFLSFFSLLFLFFLLYLASIHSTVTQQFLWLPSFVQNSCLVLTIVPSVVLGVLQVCFFFWRYANLIYFEVRGKIRVIYYQVWWRVVHICVKVINEFCI